MGTLKQEIKKAIESHILWKKELSGTINSGKLQTPIDIIEKDTECEFGRWLLTSKLVQKKSSLAYNDIVILHCEFHKLAGKVATLAVAGKKEAAKKLMADGGSYATISSKLIQALNDWDVSKNK